MTPVILGGGLAGLCVALTLAPKPVIVLGRKVASGLTSSELAQGGIAAAVGADDSTELHIQDTLAAGAGLCDPAIVRQIIEAGPAAIEQLIRWGVAFDRDEDGDLKRGLEGAHCRRRVVHANGDATGDAVMRVLVAKAKATPAIRFMEGCEVTEIKTDASGVCAVVFRQDGKEGLQEIESRAVVLATGSACALWRHTTVPVASWGHGLLLAHEAGAALRDLEFVQFHPTALDSTLDPMPLISEALRGAGGKLVTEAGESFVDELCPRDVVARAIWSQLERGQRVFLDARHIDDFGDHFPTILESCLRGGIDPREEGIPVRPVAHYHMGGIQTDGEGKTTVEGLWACGECASTGLHGANRLASNSLLEAVVMGCRIGRALQARAADALSCAVSEARGAKPFTADDLHDTVRVRNLMMAHVGVLRESKGLETALCDLEPLASVNRFARVGMLIAKSALARRESCGAHTRLDTPCSS